VLNQFAAPGLGSIMAGRYLAGACQLFLSLAGFGLIVVWFFLVLKAAYAVMETSGEPVLPHYLGWMGLGDFLLAWGWAWLTSLSILRQAKRAQDERWAQRPPPVFQDGLPSPDPGRTDSPPET
jgi:hypothetical protein